MRGQSSVNLTTCSCLDISLASSWLDCKFRPQWLLQASAESVDPCFQGWCNSAIAGNQFDGWHELHHFHKWACWVCWARKRAGRELRNIWAFWSTDWFRCRVILAHFSSIACWRNAILSSIAIQDMARLTQLLCSLWAPDDWFRSAFWCTIAFAKSWGWVLRQLASLLDPLAPRKSPRSSQSNFLCPVLNVASCCICSTW